MLPLTEADMAAMPTQTEARAERYLHEFDECIAWELCQPRFKVQKMKISDPNTFDEVVVTTYLNKLFLEGSSSTAQSKSTAFPRHRPRCPELG